MMIEVQIGKLAEKFSVHRNTVSNWIKTGKLAAQPTIAKRYLIEKKELLRFCEEFGISKNIIHEFKKRDNLLVSSLPTTKNLSKKGSLDQSSLRENPLEGKQLLSSTMKIRKEVNMTDKPIGSVMVVGGGIAGIQATLDLAESGYRVYMVEKSAGIGGAMAQLDKTFPTNDCAM